MRIYDRRILKLLAVFVSYSERFAWGTLLLNCSPFLAKERERT
jgi:hypothetical protein